MSYNRVMDWQSKVLHCVCVCVCMCVHACACVEKKKQEPMCAHILWTYFCGVQQYFVNINNVCM